MTLQGKPHVQELLLNTKLNSMIFSGFFLLLFLRKQRKNIKLGGEEEKESLGGSGGQRNSIKYTI